MRDRYRSEGTATTSTPSRRTRARTATTRRVDRRAAVVERPRRHGRQLVRGDHAGARGARAAAAPDGDLAGRRADEQLPEPVARGRRDAAAHVLGALHPRPGRPGHRRRPGEAGRGLGRPARPPRAVLGDAVGAGPDVAAPRAAARADADRLLDARRLRRVLAADRERLHALLGRARRRPGHVLDRLVRPVPRTPTSSTSRRWRRRTRRRSASSSGRGATSGCAATRPSRSTSTSGRTPSGACGATSRSSSRSSTAGSRTTRTGSPTARRRSGSS